MSHVRIAVTMNEDLLHRLDLLVTSKVFPSRSRAIQEAVEEKLTRVGRTRLARECAKLDPDFEKSLAEEGMSRETDLVVESLNDIIGNRDR